MPVYEEKIGGEVMPPLEPIWKKIAHFFRAIPVCRTCATRHSLTNLHSYNEKYQCQIARCENESAYLAII